MPTPQFILDLREKIGHDPLFLTGVTGIVLREHRGRQQVLLVRRTDNGQWTPVSGIVEPDQQVHEVVVREVLEEACVVAAIERLVWVRTHPMITYPNGDQTSYVNLTFRMRHVSGEPRPGDDEQTDARWCDVDALPPMDPDYRDRVLLAVADEPGCVFGDLPGLRFSC